MYKLVAVILTTILLSACVVEPGYYGPTPSYYGPSIGYFGHGGYGRGWRH